MAVRNSNRLSAKLRNTRSSKTSGAVSARVEADMGHLGHRHLAGAEAARMEVNCGTLGENGAGPRTDDDGDPPVALIDERRGIGERRGQTLMEIATASPFGKGEPLLRPGPAQGAVLFC